MRLILNENVAGTVIRELRERGHDVVSVKDAMRGEADEAVLARAPSEQRLLVTHDKDFGELAFRSALPATSGVILLRLSSTDPDRSRRRILEVIESRDDWAGHFAVASDDRVRLRPLPGTPGEHV